MPHGGHSRDRQGQLEVDVEEEMCLYEVLDTSEDASVDEIKVRNFSSLDKVSRPPPLTNILSVLSYSKKISARIGK
jgi:hypothetical protein